MVIAAEVAGTGIGRIRMSPVPDVAARSLERCVRAAISEGSVVHIDGWRRYSGLKRRGYQHRPKNIAASGDPAHEFMPRVHRVASLLKHWWWRHIRGRLVMPFSPTTSMSLSSGLIAVPRGRGACCSTGSSSRLCLWSRYRTRSSSGAGILMKTTGREYESEMDTPLDQIN